MKRFNLFLIISLLLTAFWAGYLIMKRDIGLGDSKSKTGTILDKFGETEQPTTNDQRPTTKEISPFLIADRKVVSISNSPDKKRVIYFEKNTGKLFEFNFEDNQETTISDTILPNFISAIWSPAKKEVVSSFYSQEEIKFKYHSYETAKTADLDNNIRSVAFSPNGDLIAYFYASENNSPDNSLSKEFDKGELIEPPIIEPNKIFIAQPDGAYPKKILDTRLENIKVSWPTGEWLAFKTTASEIFLLNQEGKLNKFLESKPLLEEKWSRSGKKMLYSALSDNMELTQPVLSIKELDSRIERPLNIEGNASKCVWSIDDINIFCALAKSPSVDEIYSINTSDGSRKFLIDSETVIKEMMLSSLENYLLFINTSDEKLYGVRLTTDDQ